jgi:hypothetical protein
LNFMTITNLPARLANSSQVPTPTIQLLDRIAQTQACLDLRRLNIPYLGISPLHRIPTLHLVDDMAVVMVPASLDPMLDGGRMPVPKAQRRQLRAIERSGAQFNDLYVGHDLSLADAARMFPSLRDPKSPLSAAARETGVMLKQDQARTLIPPARPSARSVKSAVRAQRLGTRLGTVAGALAIAPAVAIVGAVPAAAALALGVLRDPVVFGVVAEDLGEGSPAGWFALAQWEW